MKASILFVTYQHERFVADAIRSAMQQDYRNLELVVCDDGSSDRTVEILERELVYCPAHISIVRSYLNSNHGFHENFNRGLSACTGDVVVAMSGDDISVPHRVSRICEVFTAHPNCMLVGSNWTRIDNEGNKIRGNGYSHNKIFSYADRPNHIYAKAPLCGAAGAYRITLRDKFPEMKRGAHAEHNCFWVRALLLGTIHHMAEPLVYWRAHDNNQSNWERNTDCRTARKKHLKFLLAHQNMGRQWSSDVRHALEKDFISLETNIILNNTISLVREQYRLRRLSLTPSSWKLWIASAIKFYRLNCSIYSTSKLPKIIKKYFNIRLSRKRRSRYWRSHFQAI